MAVEPKKQKEILVAMQLLEFAEIGERSSSQISYRREGHLKSSMNFGK
jgi:hypothetical protein